MQTQPIRATAPKARTRKEIFAVETSTGAADKYFRIGPGTSAWAILAAVERMSANFASLVVSGNTALPRTTSEHAERRRPRAGPGGIVAGVASSGGLKAVRQDRRSARRDSRWSTGSRLWTGPMNSVISILPKRPRSKTPGPDVDA